MHLWARVCSPFHCKTTVLSMGPIENQEKHGTLIQVWAYCCNMAYSCVRLRSRSSRGTFGAPQIWTA